jgi:RimJ/RimL family protein N-acetyltransferase
MTAPRCTRPPEGAAARAALSLRAHVPTLETERLRLRAPAIEDISDWTHVWLVDFAERGDGAERAWTEFGTYASGWLLHGHGLWSVDRKSDGLLVGFVLLGLEWSDHEPELGYVFLRDHRRQGYAAEACTAARDYGFTLLDTFVSYVDPGNVASNRLAERLGARRDAEAEARIGDGETDSVHVWRYGRAA